MSIFQRLTLLLLLLAGSSAFSQALPVGVSPVFAPTVTTTGISYAGGVASSANAASITFANAANGAVYAQATQKVALGGGATANLVLKSAPTGPTIAAALGRFAGKALPVLATGVALYDLAKELGFDVGNSSGTLVVKKPDPNVCSTAPCYVYALSPSNYLNGVFSTSVAAATSAQCRSVGWPSGCSLSSAPSTWSGSSGTGVLSYVENGQNKTASFNVFRYSTSPVVPTTVPGTVQELQDVIAAQSGWPSGSAINRAINDAITSGEVIPLPEPSIITGPASVPLSPSVQTNPDGSTVTKTPTKQLTYSPPSVAVTDSVQSVARDPAGNPVGTTSTVAPTEMPETCGYPGGPPCKIDETGTPDKAQEKAYNPLADAVKANKDAGTTKMAGPEDKASLFSGWSMFWNAPAVVQCAPYQLPNWNGQSMGALDPCGVVDGVRTVMAYIWSLTGLFMCLGFVRESIQQG